MAPDRRPAAAPSLEEAVLAQCQELCEVLVEHEPVEQRGRIGEALFINDSKATNADSTEKALKSFDDIFWILGGKAKEGGIEPLREYFPKIRKAYLIGAAAEDFARTLGSDVPHVRSETLDTAVEQAASDAAVMNGPSVVLLSPACASFDQFPDYEQRGLAFKALVEQSGS